MEGAGRSRNYRGGEGGHPLRCGVRTTCDLILATQAEPGMRDCDSGWFSKAMDNLGQKGRLPSDIPVLPWFDTWVKK